MAAGSVTRIVLPTGVRLVVEPIEAARSVAVSLTFVAGSIDESDAMAGATHFCEHLLFKGTQRHTWEDIARLMNEHGGHANAMTSNDHVMLYTRVVREDFADALGLLAELALDSTFPEREIERERGVILEEIAEYEDAPDELCFERFLSSLFPDCPAGRPVIGTPATVKAMGRTELLGYWQSVARGSNLIVSVAGDIAGLDVEGTVARALSAIDPGPVALTAGGEVARPASVRLAVERDLQQVYCVLGVPGPEAGSEERFALTLLESILGGGMGSRLFSEVRERLGLVYSIGSSASMLRGHGYMTVSASMAPENVSRVVGVVERVLKDLCDAGPTEDELVVAKRQAERNYLLSLDSTSSRSMRNAVRVLYGMPDMSDREYRDRVWAVDREAVRDLCGRLWSVPAAACFVGPTRALDVPGWLEPKPAKGRGMSRRPAAKRASTRR